jgi:hypothetical protein
MRVGIAAATQPVLRGEEGGNAAGQQLSGKPPFRGVHRQNAFHGERLSSKPIPLSLCLVCSKP